MEASTAPAARCMLVAMKALPFIVWTWIGIIAWRVNVMLPGEHHRLRIAAFALGLAGAWTGGYIAAMMLHGSLFSMDWRTVVGSVVGAAAQLAAFDLVARAVARQQAGARRAAEVRARQERHRAADTR